MSLTPSRLPTQRGLTLLELIVVMVILGLLVSLVGPDLWSRLHQSRVKTAAMQITLLGSALGNYRLDVGRYPTTTEGLVALMHRPPGIHGWSGPYLARGVPLDPWGHPYHYRSPGKHGAYDLWSTGSGHGPRITSWSTQGLAAPAPNRPHAS
ncbi:type II secretion system major pseudopilin GspG [Acidiferrobacter sp.]|uniref:type II secretion system major pseudopilin GspG n=1 Tax=Acidiferrobacter sp. TaxID=1872107 RepID=UPI00261D5DD7|nr:type II secretion system major pseudopilin GspG [Acidiferrobacter sp.]